MTSYSDAKIDAADMAENFLDEIVKQLVDDGEASKDFNNDYPDGDSYHHESHVDKSYSLLEAAEILETFSEHEETDSGLWQGLEPRRAIEAQAAYTYGAAVASEWSDLIGKINEIPEELEDELEAIEETRAAKEERFNELSDSEEELTAAEQEELEGLELGDYDAAAAEAKKALVKKAVEEAISDFRG